MATLLFAQPGDPPGSGNTVAEYLCVLPIIAAIAIVGVIIGIAIVRVVIRGDSGRRDERSDP